MWQSRWLRTVLLAIVLLGGNFAGVPMRKDDIEQLLNAHNQVKVEESIRNKEIDEDGEAETGKGGADEC
jgi:hypothetical protein